MVERRNQQNDPSLRAYLEQVEREVAAEVWAQDPVARQCHYVSFVSRSKGRGRPRPKPIEVELVGYNGRHYQIKDGRGPMDKIATEVLGGSVDPDKAEKELLLRLRRLP